MWSFKRWAVVMVFVGLVSAKAYAYGTLYVYEVDVPDREISALYTSLAPQSGGIPEIGGRFRFWHLEAEVMSLNNQIGIEAGYTYRFEVGRWFLPRLVLGVAYAFNNFNLAPGVSYTVPIIPIGHTFLGVSLDTYFYIPLGPSSQSICPVIPLSVVYIF